MNWNRYPMALSSRWKPAMASSSRCALQLNAGDVGRQPGRVQRADVLRRRDEHLAAKVAALLLRRELVLVVDPGRTGIDKRPGQLERVERTSETGLRIGHDGRQPVEAGVVPLGEGDLVGAQQRVVDPPDYRGHRG